MKISVLYIVPLDARDEFRKNSIRWADSYRKFTPKIQHDVIICWAKGKPNQDDKEPFRGINYKSFYYGGGGWDIGAEQHVACQCEADLFVAQNSRTYYHRAGWLERLAAARAKHGDNLYAITVSLEHCPILPMNTPNTNIHVRTAVFAMSSNMWRKYPYTIDNREKGFLFESGDWKYLTFYEHLGHKAYLVTFDGIYDRKTWGLAKNTFRNGDQSSLLVFDRHSDIYAESQPARKQQLQMAAGL